MRWPCLSPAVALALTCAMSTPLTAQPFQPMPPFSPAVVAGDFVYLSGTLATDASGALVPGDIRQQAARVLDSLAASLEASGSRMEQAAAVTVYLANAADFAAMNEVYAKYWPKDPPTRTTIVAKLVMPGALVEMSMIALRDGVERHVVHPAAWIKSPNPYSYGIRSKNTLFLSGLIARNGRDNSFAAGDMKAQTTAVLENARAILQEAGMSLADVVSSRVYITDTALFQDMNAVYRDAFPNVPPARATVRCGLTGKDYLVEITMTAVKDPARQAVIPKGPLPPAPAPGKPSGPAGVALRPVLSAAIGVAGRLYVSGMLGNTAATRDDAAAQTRQVLARIGDTLESAGYSWSDVVDAVVYMPDLAGFQAMNAAYRERFAGPPPARATVQVGLVAPDALVEIAMTAVKGDKAYPRATARRP